MSSSPDLRAPALLVAMPQVLDRPFRRSVVLLLHLDEEGSFGFVVNRPTTLQVHDILEGMEIEWGGEQGALAYNGGPVQPQVGTILFDSRQHDLLHSGQSFLASEALPGLAITQHVNDLALLAAEPPAQFRLFLGYSGWGEGQLLEEILRNDWIIAPVSTELLFPSEPQDTWKAALASVGVDADSLPMVSSREGYDKAN